MIDKAKLNSLKFWFPLFILIVINSCKDEKPEAELSITPKEVNYSVTGGKEDISVTSNTEWRVYTDAMWCSISKNKGEGDDVFTILVKENISHDTLEAKVIVIAKGITGSIYITQLPMAEQEISLSVSRTEYEFEPEGGSFNLAIECNSFWAISNVTEWCIISDTTGTGNASVNIRAQENQNKTSRTNTLTIATDGLSKQVVINQKKNEAPDTIVFE